MVWVPANTSLSLTLCLHELATNAVKYGALSNETGQVHVLWGAANDTERRKLHLTWQETGGPSVTAPMCKGFGSLLIQATGEADTHIGVPPGRRLGVCSTFPSNCRVGACIRRPSRSVRGE
jgi:two-component sensor histidine kinase